jgi:uncharacterized protein (TIGR03118 family)
MTVKRPLAAFGLASLLCSIIAPASATPFGVTNLVTNDQNANAAQITDPDLLNAWGISYAPTGPFWVSDNHAAVTTLYQVDPNTNLTTKLGLTVSIPGDGSITGQTFNSGFSGGSFNSDLFVFVSEDGTISGWKFALGTAAETLQVGSDLNVYKGTTMETVGTHSYLLSANFRSGTIDVFKGDAAAPDLAGKFVDPNLPAGYAPFNVQNINGNIFVTYAVQDADKKDEVAAAGNGIVDEYDTNGILIARVGSNGGVLNAPWGLAMAPASFGDFAGDLLVGNFGDGTINAFNLLSDSFVGTLKDANGNPIAIDGLWGLIPGNGAMAGNGSEIYFSAGPNEEGDGLFGVISNVPEPTTLALFAVGLTGAAAIRRRKKSRT